MQTLTPNSEINKHVFNDKLIQVYIPGFMRALSETLKVVTFCFGGTPAFRNISICFSDLCQSKMIKKRERYHDERREISGRRSTSTEQQLDFWHFKINRGPVITVREPNTHTRRHTHAHLAVSVSDICFHSAHYHLSPSSHSKLALSPSVD